MACTQFAVHYINWFPFKFRFWIKATMCLSRQNDPLMQMILQSSLWALYIETYSCTSQKKLAAQPRRLLKLLSWTFSCSAHFCCAFFKFHCFLLFLFSPCFCSFFHFNWVLFNFHYCFSIFPLCLFNFCSVLSTCVGSYSTSVSFIQLIFIFAIFIVFFIQVLLIFSYLCYFFNFHSILQTSIVFFSTCLFLFYLYCVYPVTIVFCSTCCFYFHFPCILFNLFFYCHSVVFFYFCCAFYTFAVSLSFHCFVLFFYFH